MPLINPVSTTYGAISQMMKFTCDQHPEINLDIIDLAFPMSHDAIVKETEKALATYNEPAIPNYTGQPKAAGKTPGDRVRLVVVDSIASNPG
jgi:hypothetical protein